MSAFYRFTIFAALLCLSLTALAENQRLILKDGTYQIVIRYEISGDRVRYISAERGGQWEEVPKNLVDWNATEKWNKSHSDNTQPNNTDAEAAAIDADEAADRAAEVARTPLVAPGLNLPDSDGVWILDHYKNVPEVVELEQNSGQLNAQKAHNVLHVAINSLSRGRQTLDLPGHSAKIQMHTTIPVIYVALDESNRGGKPYENDPDALTVPTGPQGSYKDSDMGGSSGSHYAIVRVDQRRDERIVGIFKVSLTGKQSNTEQVIAANTEVMPGNQWMKVTPQQPLSPGEYALVELLPKDQINLDVWDFGVNPEAPENAGAETPINAVR
ncbi:MAG TPA: hypothetical protein VHX63_05050 [Acidobacteriaceae bacterium]|jgi:hypothetical protein|nr:hypothetical protein [Acidobacteriaceae bacterium]